MKSIILATVASVAVSVLALPAVAAPVPTSTGIVASQSDNGVTTVAMSKKKMMMMKKKKMMMKKKMM